MAQVQTCQVCGAVLGPDIPEGVCPACALSAAILPTASERIGADAPSSPSWSMGTMVHYFGDYELLGEIGRGGMGVVYRARQVSLNRKVALKMILAGRLASETDVKRFDHEAQAAANLHHPNIVSVHEVGVHDGQHYYSMELIEGLNLAELVRQQPLSARQAAQYVKTVAEAVHFAHLQGTLHRDLKPTNILIDIRDQPRITDFGLARCEQLDPHLTTSGQILGTPAFMPPEQAQAKTGAVGTHSDIYSVGAVLYYLLTQRAPFAAESMADLLDLVVHREPISPRALNPSVPRDLETICLKCLEKDPRRRYSSAQELAHELGRFSRGEPILARPASVPEKAWRWCARNPAWATAAILLLVGAVVSTSQAVRATRAESRQFDLRVRAEDAEKAAKSEASTSQQVVFFLRDMLNGVGPSVALGRDTKMLGEIVDKAAERVGKELQGQPEVRAYLESIIGDVYRELGRYEKAEAIYREVVATVKNLRGSEHADLASALSGLGCVLQEQGKLKEAESLDREALAMRRRLLGNDHPDVATALENLAQALGLQGKLGEAEAKLREVVDMQRKLLGNEHPDVATSIQNLGQTLRVEGHLAPAETMEREALAMRRKILGNDHPDVATSLNGLGIVLEEQGRLDEAETVYREASALRKKLLGNEHPDVAQSLNNLANLFRDQGKLAGAEAMHRDALAMERKVLGDKHPNVANSLNNLALVLREEGKLGEAETKQREALAIWRNRFGPEHPQVATALNNLATVFREENKLAEAETTQTEALAMSRKLLGDEHPNTARALHNQAGIVRRQGKLEAAETMLREALAARRNMLGSEHPDVATSLEDLAEVLREAGKVDEVEALLRECLSIREKRLPDRWPTFSARSALGENLIARKNYAEAELLLISGYNGLNERQAKIPAGSKQCFKQAIQRLIRLYEETARPDTAAEWKQRLGEVTKPTPEATSGVDTKAQ